MDVKDKNNIAALQEYLGKIDEVVQAKKKDRKRIINYLAERNIRISLEEVEEIAGGRIIARPHFAQVMVNKGYVSNTREAFDRFLDTEEYQKIERYKASARECIEAIHSASGKAFLAHPYQLKYTNEELETLVLQLIDIGLDGLECYYPIHSEEQIQFYLQLAEKYQLLISAGSDFHGENVKPNIVLSDRDIDVFWL